MRTIWMFSGQGSQYFNMGRDLLDADEGFRSAMRDCDAHYRRLTGASLLDVIYPRPAPPPSGPAGSNSEGASLAMDRIRVFTCWGAGGRYGTALRAAS
jgi:malonyl CoA-acyl carrier protein transacylase